MSNRNNPESRTVNRRQPPYGPTATLHAVAPHGWGAVPDPEGRGRASSQDDVAWIELSIRLEPNGSRIRKARFLAAGSPLLRAAGSVLCRLLPGLRILEARHVDARHLKRLLGQVPARRRELLDVAVTALQACLREAARKVCRRMEDRLHNTRVISRERLGARVGERPCTARTVTVWYRSAGRSRQ